MKESDKSIEYQKVFIPLIDIYEDGEEEAFIRLSERQTDEKNLIIFPSEYRDNLGSSSYGLRRGAGSDALEYLNKKHVISRTSDYSLRESDSGLDIATILQPGFLKNPKDLISNVNNYFQGQEIKVITANRSELLRYKDYGIDAEKPKDFILVDKDIVNQGIIPGEEYPELFSKLESSEKKSIPLELAQDITQRDFFLNQFIRFGRSGSGGTRIAHVTADYKWDKDHKEVIEVTKKRLQMIKIPDQYSLNIGNHNFTHAAGAIQAENLEQYLAMQYAILNPNIETAFIAGAQGSGKTLITYAGVLELILEYDQNIRDLRCLDKKIKSGFYKQILVFRPNDTIGGRKRQEGYLKGDTWNKTGHRFGGFINAHEYLENVNFGFDEMIRDPKKPFEELPPRTENLKINQAYLPHKNPAMHFPLFGDVRGASFEKKIAIVDEGQNFNPKEIKALIQRLSHHCKMVILGDPDQVDNPECDEDRNGLTSAIKHYFPYENTIVIGLLDNRRSASSRRSLSWRT